MTTSWTKIRDALINVVVNASGLPAANVIWTGQNVPQPALDYVVLALSGIRQWGIDDTIDDTDLTRPAGQEVALTLIGWREVTLTISVFTAATVSDQNKADAMQLCERIRSTLRMPSAREALDAVGFVPVDPLTVEYIPTVVGAGFRGRATVDVISSMPAPAIVEYTTYVSTLGATVTTDAGSTALTLPL